MKKYYHISRVDYIPVEGIYALVYRDTTAVLSLREGYAFLPLPVLVYDRQLEVADTLDAPGRLYTISFSATLADDFDPAPLRRQRIVLRITDTLGTERLLGSVDFGADVTCPFSNSVASGTLGHTFRFSASSDHPALTLEYADYTSPAGFVLSPSALFLAQGEGGSSVYQVLPEDALKKK